MRSLLKYLLIFLSVTGFAQPSVPVDWKTKDAILARVVPPVFPSRTFSILDFNAVGNGTTSNTAAIAAAVSACNAGGGGTVLVPAGKFLTGPIHLKSNVNLHLAKGAVLLFSTDPAEYLPLVLTRWEGVEVMNYSPLIYAYEQENIAVTGEGVLDGQGSNEHWWSWKGKEEYGWKKGMPHQKNGRDKLFAMAEKNVPVKERIFGDGWYLRPSFVQPYRSKNVLISGVTFKDSPMWFLNPTLCSNVTIENVTVSGTGPNNDGCDPESSNDVVIRGCTFNTGDDCIAIKSGRNADGRRINVPTENVVIQKCVMKDGHGGVVLGSELSGSIRNVFVEDCVMDSPALDRALRFKTNSVRGGVIENFFARRITVGEVAEAVVLVDFNYEEGDTGPYTPVMRNIFLSDITAKKGRQAVFAKGYARSPITNIVMENCTFESMKEPNTLENVSGLTVRNVTVNGVPMKNK
jgi:polygalacturonase